MFRRLRKTQTGKRRSWVKWLLLPLTVLLLVVYDDCGFFLPSADTQQLRQTLAGATRIKVEPITYKSSEGVVLKSFVLDGQDATDFIRSILLRHPVRNYLGDRYGTNISPSDVHCTFYRKKKVLGELSIYMDNGTLWQPDWVQLNIFILVRDAI